jgi:hypothetical protein
MRFNTTLVAALLAAALCGGDQALAQSAKDPDEKPEDYPAGAHRDDTFYRCTACHGFKIVAAQGLSRERWDESITWMSEKHNMPKLEGDERTKVLDYLAATFPEKTQNQRGFRNPFAN